MGRRTRGCKQLLHDLKEKRVHRKLKEEALDRTVWRTRFGRDSGPVVRDSGPVVRDGEPNVRDI